MARVLVTVRSPRGVRAPLGALDDVVDRIGVAIRTSFDLDGASVEVSA